MSSQASTIPPQFSSAVIQPDRTDGYWVETIKIDTKDRVPGIIA